jgi:hypothetical protein
MDKTLNGEYKNKFKRFLAYCQLGDYQLVKEILETKNEDYNLKKEGLIASIESKQIEIINLLLDFCQCYDELREGLLLAIYRGYYNIVKLIFKHRKYQNLSTSKIKNLYLFSQINNSILYDSQFSPDLTPMQLACSLANQYSSQLNRFKIVQLLFDKGHRIEKPHELKCKCGECLNRFKIDSFRHAQSRLNSYKGLTSEIYITLVSDDPIITCFNLRKEVLFLAKKDNLFQV